MSEYDILVQITYVQVVALVHGVYVTGSICRPVDAYLMRNECFMYVI